MADKHRVLFLCTGNSCRSQMAEALLRHLGAEKYESLSAGSQPAGFIHDLALAALEQMEIPLGEQSSKSWDEFRNEHLDLVITLCDSAAAETCPTWPGAPLSVHWGLPDPAYHPGSPEERIEFAITIAHRLHDKILGLIALDWSRPPDEIRKALERLAEI